MLTNAIAECYWNNTKIAFMNNGGIRSDLIKGNLITQQVQEFSRFSEEDQSYIVRDIYVRKREPLRNELEAFARRVLRAT